MVIIILSPSLTFIIFYVIFFARATYRQPDTILHLSQTQLIQTHIYTNPYFLLAPWKYLTEMNPKQRWSFEKSIFCGVMGVSIICYLITQYMLTWRYGQKYKNMMSSKCVRTCNCIYVGFYVNPQYWKYTWMQARFQAPQPRGPRKMVKLKGAFLWLWFLNFF